MNQENSAAEEIKQSYSEEEISHIYELGRLFLENGTIHQAETIFLGLTQVAQDFVPAWLGLAYVQAHAKNFEDVVRSARTALRVDPSSVEATLFLVIGLLSTKDFNSAGTSLGEVRERIESGLVEDPNIVRVFKSQVARFQARL